MTSPAARDAAAWLREALGPSVDRIRACGEAGAADAERVHAARVATRRLRADLASLRGSLGGHWDGDVRPELAWIGGLLGSVRDADVRGLAFARALEHAPDAVRSGGPRLCSSVGSERDRAHASLLVAVNSPRFATLVAALQTLLTDPPVASDLDVEPSIVMKPVWRALKRGVRDLGREPSDRELHGVRIAAKRARYAAEMFASTDRVGVRRFARRAARVQDALGRQHDAAVAVSWLLHTPPTDPGVGLATGWLAARFAEERDLEREAWRAPWEELTRPEARFW